MKLLVVLSHHRSLDKFPIVTPLLFLVSCNTKPIDLVFVVDESGSIGIKNFGRIKNFLLQFVEQLTISNTAFHVGLVKFHKAATTHLQLDRYSQKYSIKVSSVNFCPVKSTNNDTQVYYFN